MNSKMPFISYVVSAKYNQNKVNFKYLHKKIFTSENFYESHKDAFEYYESCIKMLMDSGKIMFDERNLDLPTHRKDIKFLISKCNQEVVKYKDSENFESGIQIHLRINRNLSMSENDVIAEGKKYLIQEFNCPEIKELKIIEKNLLQEFKIYKRFKNQKFHSCSYFTINENAYEKEITTLLSYNCVKDSKASSDFKIELTKKQRIAAGKEVEELLKTQNPLKFEQMNENNIVELGQTVCAFLNGNEVAYIDLNYNAQHPFFLKATMDLIFEQFLEDLPYVQLFDNVKIKRKRYIIIRIDGANYPNDCARVSATPSAKIEDYEVYQRTRFGNVLVLE